MEKIFFFDEFSEFFTDTSEQFSGNQISYTEINSNHFLIFEKIDSSYNLYISKYTSVKNIGISSPEILELLVKEYDKTDGSHRQLIKQYLY